MNRSPLQKIGIILLGLLALWLGARYVLPILLPFLLAAALALAAEPMVRVLHHRLHLPRVAASGVGVVLCLLLAVLVVLTFCALLLRQLGSLSGVLPDMEQTALSGMDALEGFLMNLAEKAPAPVSPILTNGVEGFFSDGTQVVNQVMTKMLSLASGILTKIPDGAFGFGTGILACFMIAAKLPDLRRWAGEKLPGNWQARYLPAARQMKRNLGLWLLAQLKLTGVTFLILCAGFFLLHIPHGPLWAFLISFVDALPILGTGTILIPWSLVCLLQGNAPQALGLLGTYGAAAILRSVLEPKLIGKQLGLDPLATLLAMYAGYRLWGILGMLFAPLLTITLTQFVAAARQP